MKKQLWIVIILSVILIGPNFVFAAWWNPMSWGVWEIFSKQTTETYVSPSINTAPTTATSTQTSNISEATSTQATIKIPVSVKTPKSLSYCNGSYWQTCHQGESFICPSQGDGYCKTSVSQNIPSNVPIQENTNILVATQKNNTLPKNCILLVNFASAYKDTDNQILLGLQNLSQAELLKSPPSSAQSISSFQSALLHFNSAETINNNVNIPQDLPFSPTLTSIQNTLSKEIINNIQVINLDEQVAIDGEDGLVGLNSINLSNQAYSLMQEDKNSDISVQQQMTTVAPQMISWIKANCGE